MTLSQWPKATSKHKLLDVDLTVLHHTLDNTLWRKLGDLDDKHHQEPASTKKLKQDNAYWGAQNLVLGLIIDMVLLMFELLRHHKD
jgi:hypothetical protein